MYLSTKRVSFLAFKPVSIESACSVLTCVVLSSCTGTQGNRHCISLFRIYWLCVAYYLVFFSGSCVLVHGDRTELCSRLNNRLVQYIRNDSAPKDY